nr:MAG TPA: hypothetical protein [Caudoviricetes sp.]
MKKITKGLCLLLAVVVCLTVVQPVSAKAKYTKTERNLATIIAYYQATYLEVPESFEIKKISKINYTANEDYVKKLQSWGLYKSRKTLSWKIDYTESNESGETVSNSLYISSKGYPYYGNTAEIEKKYDDNTDYTKSNVSKKFVKHVKKLTKQTYDRCEEWW